MYHNHGMKLAISRLAMVALSVVFLAACGGSGNPGSGGGTLPPNPPTILIQTDTSTVPANPLMRLPAVSAPTTIQLTARVRGTGGAVVADGTTVNISTNNVSVGTVSIPDDPETDDVNEFAGFFANVGTETSGGNATFFFTSGETPGTARLTVSTTDPGTGNAVTAFIDITVTPVDPAEQVTITAGQTALPVNSANVGPFIGSPFLTEVSIQFVGVDGVAVNPADDSFGVSIAPVSSASFSTLDDPETEDVNEFFESLGQGPVNTVGGQAIIFVNAGTQPGTATLTVSGADQLTGENFSVVQEFTISGGAADGIPVSASLQVPGQPVFVQGVGSNNSLLINAQLTDAGGQLVSAPEDINNVVIELVPPEPNNSRLQAVDASGTTVSGNEISIPSVNGLATFSFISGNSGGVHQLKVTADGADNNVDNGIQQPVTGISSLTVGNGQLAAIELVSPTVNAITINRVSDVVDPDEDLEVDPDTGVVIPPDPDGTYSLPYTIIVTDPFGAPVPAGTVISFGKVDTPTFNASSGDVFTFSGIDGNPLEGSNFFRVPEAQADDFDGFLDDSTGPDEAVQNNDTLLTFGKSVPGNDELEGARFVSEVIDDFSLRLQSEFNDNNGAGVSVDDGPRIPYVIGRSNTGNIVSQAQTAADGIANVRLSYPINALGQPVAIWAQGTRPDGTSIQTVGDVISARFPGIAPAILSVSPNGIPANTTRTVVVCLRDALNAPISNGNIGVQASDSFSFSINPANPVTGSNGCVNVAVTTSGFGPDDTGRTINFIRGGAVAELSLFPPSLAFITASPSALTLTSGSRSVLVSVFDSNGDPISGLQVTADCDAPVVVGAGNVTDEDGETTFALSLDSLPEEATSSSCVFSATAGGQTLSTSVTVNIPGTPPVPPSPDPDP